MSEGALVNWWLSESLDDSVKRAIERMSRLEDVARIAVMPDVHLAGDICVGTATATRRLLYPAAVGGDIGCGMLAVAFDADADALRSGEVAGRMLRRLTERIPQSRRHRRHALPLPAELRCEDLSAGSLAGFAREEATLQLGTLGGGNHFVELQADEQGRLWLMLHTGSRALGQAVRNHHVAAAINATAINATAIASLDADADAGLAYLNDAAWASGYAAANRQAIATIVCDTLRELISAEPIESSLITCDHNHVRREMHDGEPLLVHRKGAMAADDGVAGVIPGSMGTRSYHVEGRGLPESLRSSAHGAGRRFSRSAARERFGAADVKHQMRNVWYDPRQAKALREELPHAYKDVRAVLRAQEALVRVTRTLTPVLAFKGT
jgi:tRNA-splicing ligase RtcB